MSTSAEPNSKQSEQSGQVMTATNGPTMQEIRSWDEAKLLKWVQQKLSKPLKSTEAKLFLNAGIDGEVFLEGAGDRGFFQHAGLPFGVSVKLARLAKDTMGRKSKWFRLHHTRYADKHHRLHHARHADVHCPRWLRHTATPDMCTLHFHFHRS